MSDLLNNLHNTDSDVWKDAPIPAESESAAPDPVEPPASPEAVAEVAAEPVAVVPDAQAEQVRAEPQQEDRRQVPLRALQEERAKRAELERRLNEIEARLTRPEPEAREIDAQTDPISAVEDARRRLAQIEEQTTRARHEQTLAMNYQQAAVEFSQQTPDFREAYGYAINSRAQELSALGMTQHSIAEALRQEEMNLVDTALRNGVNPAEAVYNFAKARGYRVASVEPKAAPKPVEKAPDPELQKARQAVAATAAATGKPANNEMTLESLAGLSGAAFDSAYEKLFGGSKSSLFRK